MVFAVLLYPSFEKSINGSDFCFVIMGVICQIREGSEGQDFSWPSFAE